MSHNCLAQYDNVFPLIQPVDLGTTATPSPYIDLLGVNTLSYLIQFGVTTENATTDIIDITVEAATTENGGAETAYAFKYRLSSAVTANTWGAVTTATATGAELNKNHEGMSLWIDVDVDALAAAKDRYIRLGIEQNAFSALFTSAVAFVNHRYHMTTMVSVTASASA